MSEDEWDQVGRLSMSPKSYGEFKKFILEACEQIECKSLKEKLRGFEGRLSFETIQGSFR
jgi:hypothetical protein